MAIHRGRFGVKLVVEGPKMRGKATVDVGVLGNSRLNLDRTVHVNSKSN